MTLRHPLPRTIRRTTALLMASCVLTATGCSSEDDNDDTATATNAGNGDSTVTIEHTYGETEVPVNPESSISFSSAWSDAFTELGQPVAYHVTSSQLADVPWTPDGTTLADEVIEISGANRDNISAMGLEAIAEKDPDVIFAGYIPDQATYDSLTEIAPTVATVGGGLVDDWREVTLTAGDIIEDTDGAQAIVDSIEDAFAQTRDDYPALDGATFAYAAYRDNIFNVINSPDDASNKFFTELGMAYGGDDIDGEESGRGISVSAENLSMLDMDFLALWITGDTPDDLPGWSSLRPVEQGTAPQLETAAATALGAPTVYSIPWMLDDLDPYFANL
ncbi:MAG: ABC transporter substrate-binding protein [Corynebacterium variabile]|uniref:ABC transporter substrate-binding protein n=1 Tax=Corynebacterium variabile TaxID=1727 RepID=UPI003F92541F